MTGIIVVIAVIVLLYFVFREKKSPPTSTRGEPPTPTRRIKFPFLIMDEGETIPENRWFQKSTQKNKSFVGYNWKRDADWKYADEGKAKVAGISRGSRTEDFLELAPREDFKMFLEDEPNNPVSKNARKIMATATVHGELVSKHIGYLPGELAEKYAGIALDIRPSDAFLPKIYDLNLGVKVALFVRSARYLKKQSNEMAKGE